MFSQLMKMPYDQKQKTKKQKCEAMIEYLVYIFGYLNGCPLQVTVEHYNSHIKPIFSMVSY